jgi:4a-hydroxytetrahydrobiopterin dehydratase
MLAVGSTYPPHMDLLSDDQVEQAIAGRQWRREGSTLVKSLRLKDFAEALEFVNRVGAVAEERNHHPDISISWNQVTLTLTTHSAGGLTAADLELAEAIDALGP